MLLHGAIETPVIGFDRDARGGAVFGGVSVGDFLQQHKIPTPVFIYDLDGIAKTTADLVAALGPAGLVAYAVKANSAGSILRTIQAAGAGADVVSGGELELALRCGFAPDKVVFSGVAKTDAEIDLALLRGVRAIHVEATEELTRIAQRAAQLSRVANVCLRLNPGVRTATHDHVATGHEKAKFGIPRKDLHRAWQVIDQSEWLNGVGISVHVGSTLAETAPYELAARVVAEEARLRISGGHELRYVDFGGGFGIDYGKGAPVPATEFARVAARVRNETGLGKLDVLIEPGRCLVGPFGLLVADVLQVKENDHNRWMLINAGMNDLLRPALYQAYHRIESLSAAPSGQPWRVAGPVCESTDDFGTHVVADSAEQVVLRDAGAYGYVMASEYNGRPLPGEAFIANGHLAHFRPSPGLENWIQSRLNS